MYRDGNSSFKVVDKVDDMRTMANESTISDPISFESLERFDPPSPEKLKRKKVPKQKKPKVGAKKDKKKQ